MDIDSHCVSVRINEMRKSIDRYALNQLKAMKIEE